MNYSIIFDIVAIAILIVSVFVMSRRGLLKSIYKIISIAVTIIAVILFSEPAEDVLMSFGVEQHISGFVSSAVLSDNDSGQEIEKLPSFFENAVEGVAENTVVPALTDAIMSVIAAILVYLICKLVLYILFLIIQGIFKMPVLKQANKLAGTVAGIVSGVIIIYLVLGVISLDVGKTGTLNDIIANTYFVKLFYNQNLLMNLFLR